jgi:septal ring factor EnvC (AmiA/AmiB activator)
MNDLAEKIRQGSLSFQRVVVELRRLLDDSQRCDVQYVRCCMAFEESEVWKRHMGDKTFVQTLRKLDLPWTARHKRIAAVLSDRNLSKWVNQIGIEAVLVLAKTRGDDRKSLLKQYRAVAKDTGKFVQRSYAHQLYRQTTGHERQKRTESPLEQRNRELEAAAKESAELIMKLRAELRAKNERIAELERINASLRRSLDKMVGGR